MEAHINSVQFAGDYTLNGIILHNHQNEGIDVADQGIDIQDLVVEMNIFESIYKHSITGSLVITDSINLIAKLPIQGTERLSFNLSTPGDTGVGPGFQIDCTERSGHPMHIYKLTDRQQLSEGIQVYTLHFCSREFLRNLRTKVSETFEGRIDQMVYKILDDENYLDSRRYFNYQKTRNQDKITIPNITPFQAIEMLSKRALAESDNDNAAGYYFYQTVQGFHFRSFESLCVTSNGVPRKPKQVFSYGPVMADEEITDTPNMIESQEVTKIEKDYSSVETYKFINNLHDVAMNQAVGTYAHRVITHNLYNKSYKISDYHYHNRFNDIHHTDGQRNKIINPPIVDTPVDHEKTIDGKRDRGVSDYPESRVTVMPTTQFSHGEETGAFGVDVENDGITEASRISQRASIEAGTRLKLTVKGQSFLEPGDLIEFNVLAVENKIESKGRLDPQNAGRYIISKIRHRVTNSEYIQILECVKDSVYTRYHTDEEDNFQGRQLRNAESISIDINQYDDISDGKSSGGF